MTVSHVMSVVLTRQSVSHPAVHEKSCFLRQSPLALKHLSHVAVSNCAMIAGKRNRDAIVMDAPIWYHTPKLILWCVFEALDLFLAIWITREWSAGVTCLPFFVPFMLLPDL